MSFLILRMLLSLSLSLNPSLAFSFFSCDRYKNGMSCTLILALRVVSFRLFRSRWFGFALHALIFLPLTVYVRVYVYARFALSLSAIDSLQTHTHILRVRVCAHTHRNDDGKRGTPRKWAKERTNE